MHSDDRGSATIGAPASGTATFHHPCVFIDRTEDQSGDPECTPTIADRGRLERRPPARRR
jgi:hypothetical protein